MPASSRTPRRSAISSRKTGTTCSPSTSPPIGGSSAPSIRCSGVRTPAAPCSSLRALAWIARAYFGALCRVQSGARYHGAHLCRRMRDHQSARQPVQPGPNAHAHDGDRVSRRRSGHAADAEEVAQDRCCRSACRHARRTARLYDFRARKFLDFQSAGLDTCASPPSGSVEPPRPVRCGWFAQWDRSRPRTRSGRRRRRAPPRWKITVSVRVP